MYYPNGVIYLSSIFFSADDVKVAVMYIEDDDFLDNQSMYVNNTITLGGLLLGFGGKASSALATLFTTAQMAGLSVDFKQYMIDDLKTKCGYDSKTKKFNYGARIDYYMSQGMEFSEVSKWN